MDQYSIVETRPVNLVIILGLFILLLCFAGATGVYYTKSHLLEVELVNERQNLAKMAIRTDYLEAKTEKIQEAYVNLVLMGSVRIGPGDMQDLVHQAQGLRTAARTEPTVYPYPVSGVGGEDVPEPKTHAPKGKKPRKSRSQ